MNLIGWDYVGRNIDSSLHKQFKTIVDCLSDPDFVKDRPWGFELQHELAEKLKTSAGQVRTIKCVCEDLSLFNQAALNRKKLPERNKILTEAGSIIFEAYCLEEKLNSLGNPLLYEREFKHIKALYQRGYVKSMINYRIKFGSRPFVYLHPLRATLRALEKYKSLDKWEWYLLNTDIRADDNPEMEALLDEHIASYRRDEMTFSMADVTEKPKGHQYLPQFFGYSGLLNVQRGRRWKLTDNGKYINIKKQVLSDNFLSEFYSED